MNPSIFLARQGRPYFFRGLRRHDSHSTSHFQASLNGVHRPYSSKKATDQGTKKPTNVMLRAGIPFVLFSVLASWVVSNAVGGKLREMEASQGKVSKSLRQAAVEHEHDEMMERLNKIAATDFDNTKRIKRPQEVLEERRRERERRNAWYRRTYRWVFRVKEEA